ncbi:hypothetical protein [Nocardioides pantholopis]|uniref:hypothetical protein n=1 Tax=Nocardioides pantholopis TaxID=2483798 RepID=UPI000F080CD1|nr:hypothetical protein [Nocardioides pantholopis]
MIAPVPRWSAVPTLLVVNLLPLWLVLDGRLETPDLLMTYAVEASVLMVLAAPTVPGLVRAASREQGFQAGAGVLLVVITVIGTVASLTTNIARQVSWDLGSVLSIAAVGVSVAIGLVLSWRRHGSPVPGRGGPVGAFAWRFLLLVAGGGLGLGSAQAWERLVAHGWEPAPLGDRWAQPAGEQLVEWGIALDLPTAVVPALFVVLVRTLNEVLHEIYLICKDLDAEDRAADSADPAPTAAPAESERPVA